MQAALYAPLCAILEQRRGTVFHKWPTEIQPTEAGTRSPANANRGSRCGDQEDGRRWLALGLRVELSSLQPVAHRKLSFWVSRRHSENWPARWIGNEVDIVFTNVSGPAVYGVLRMSLDENSALHELASCRQEKKTSGKPTISDGGFVAWHHEVVQKPASRTCATAGSRQQRDGPEPDF
jgi:hypothetical protein